MNLLGPSGRGLAPLVTDQEAPFIVAGPDVAPFMLHLYASVAVKERRLISERTSAALQAKKASDKPWVSRTGRVVERLGKPNIKDLTGTGVVTLKANADAFAERVLPMIADAQRCGHTRPIAAELERLHVKPARGGSTWDPKQVADILKRVPSN